MYTTTFLTAAASLLACTSAAPVEPRAGASFLYFVSTSTSERATNPDPYTPTNLPDVKALGIYDPSYQANFLLRLVDPGYNSLNTYTFGAMPDGSFFTYAYPPHIYNEEVQYFSQPVADDGELQLSQTKAAVGDQPELQLRDGYLLTKDGDAEGWTICDRDEESVLVYKGTEDGCTKTYVQAYVNKPY